MSLRNVAGQLPRQPLTPAALQPPLAVQVQRGYRYDERQNGDAEPSCSNKRQRALFQHVKQIVQQLTQIASLACLGPVRG